VPHKPYTHYNVPAPPLTPTAHTWSSVLRRVTYWQIMPSWFSIRHTPTSMALPKALMTKVHYTYRQRQDHIGYIAAMSAGVQPLPRPPTPEQEPT
jgi:hypothetical protein